MAFMYILQCNDGSFYTGSTIDIDRRLDEHQSGQGANYTRKRLPVRLIYLEEFDRIDEAYFREQQIKNWTKKKKRALIEGKLDELKKYAKCMNASSSDNHNKDL